MELLGVGKDKITNVQKSLARHGEGYEVVIKRLLNLRKSKIKKLKKIERTHRSAFEKLKKKYPLHFLLFNLIDEIGEFLGDEEIQNKEALLITPSSKKKF